MRKKPFNPLGIIPKPCKEDWYQMTGDEKRRHCGKCDTHVVDLTGMSEEEILALREKNGGKLCGAFRLSPTMAKSFALGSGITSLALAACVTKGEIAVPGIGCPPPAEKEPAKKKSVAPPTKKPDKNPTEEKVTVEPIMPKPLKIVKPPVPMLMGDICLPNPAQPKLQPGSGPV